MFLKNYTSEQPVTHTIARIEAVLIRAGVSGITKEYSAGPNPTTAAIRFHLATPGGERTVRIPARVEEALSALWEEHKLRHPNSRKSRAEFTEQARRTAWKIAQDWIEVQVSLIQLKQAEPLEVFLPYLWDGAQTFYEQLKGGGFKMLPEKAEAAA